VSREWKPGDVALRTSHNADPYAMRSMAALTCSGVGHDRGLHWHHENGGWDPMEGKPSYRPFVVIDPEDREQVKRLALAYCKTFAAGDSIVDRALSVCADQMQTALREFADPKPPKCRAALTLTTDAALYICSRIEGHDGPHHDGGTHWSVGVS